eukprot:TRINITY_DN14980_c0_g6_i2.p1 TRINITY_DN14980_c0_g6~~TRINITY_DN14980_c0_g6_i2.p1  ORF type:complete len:596 (+),score=122.56 TRINITY_DN14980_c0_g6_i2:32-1819(+)
MLPSVALVAATIGAFHAALAENRWGERVAIEERLFANPGSTSSWSKAARAKSDELVDLIFMLRHDKAALASFEQTLLDVSTPGSKTYGRHLSRAEVAERLPPIKGAKAAVLAWLKEHGVSDSAVHAGSDMVEVAVPAGIAEEMLQTELHHFLHARYSVDLIRAAAPYTLPSEIARGLYLVGNLVQLPSLTGPLAVESSPEANDDFPNGCGGGCKGKVTPLVLQKAYQLETSPNVANTSMAVAEFQGQSWDASDLQHFTKTCQLQSPATVAKQVGTNAGLACKVPAMGPMLCLEALLDIEYIKAVAGDIPLTSVSDFRYSLLNWAKQLDDMKDVPLIQSVSYGNDERQQTSTAFMDAVNAQFMKLGARGVSVLFASGDQGVYGRSGVDTDGKFHPDFPAASPYVTAVGGTDFAQKSVIGAEKAWTAGGGGFSDHFPAPAWQQEAVSGYLKAAGAASNLPKSSAFNAKGRGYPDVSALGGQQNPYCVATSFFVASTMSGVAGTSASCPVVAGIFARLNALRTKEGKSPLGFLNPFIYQNQDAFNDVKLGKNNADGPEGFEAMEGWDPVTGFGSPNFPKLKAAALAASAAVGDATLVV